MLKAYLQSYERDGLLQVWEDTRLLPGTSSREELELAIDSASVAVLLVTQDFLASDCIATHELPRLIVAAQCNELRILPISVRACLWEDTQLASYQPVNPKPLNSLRGSTRDEAFVQIVKKIIGAYSDKRDFKNSSAVAQRVSVTQIANDITTQTFAVQWPIPHQLARQTKPPKRSLIPALYRRALENRLIQPLPILSGNRRSPKLREFYVPLILEWLTSELTGNPQLEECVLGRDVHIAGVRFGATSRSIHPLEAVLKLESSRFLLIEGDPGSGKSTLLNCIVSVLLHRDEDTLPILLELRDFGRWLGARPAHEDRPETLLEWGGEFLATVGVSSAQIRQSNDWGCLWWLLDGLDEVGDMVLRIRVAKIIEAMVLSSEQTGNRVWLTSRPHATADPIVGAAVKSVCAVASLLPLEGFQRQLLFERWFLAVCGMEKNQSLIRAETLEKRLYEHPEMQALTRTPLLATALASVFQLENKFPERGAGLYNEAIRLFLQQRFGPPVGGSDEGVRRIWNALSRIAYEMMEEGAIGEVGEEDFYRFLRDGWGINSRNPVKARVELERIAAQLGHHSGLLRISGNPARFGFVHLRFQEFLAAQAISRHKIPLEIVISHLSEQNWRETFLLLGDYVGETRSPQWVINFFNGWKEALATRPHSCRHLELMISCAIAARIKDALWLQELRKFAIKALEDSEDTCIVSSRLELALALGRLGDVRLGMEKAERWVSIEPGTFIMGDDNSKWDWDKPSHKATITQSYYVGRFPVTNIEFRQFIEAGGYHRSEYWSDEGWRWRNLRSADFESYVAELVQNFPLLGNMLREQVVPGDTPRWWHDYTWNAPNLPVVGVSWYEANAYCRWLTEYLNRINPPWWCSGMRVQLLTESQWEIMARGYLGRMYPWGDREPDENYANYDRGRLNRTSPVGIYPRGATPEGCLDVAGNVWEWCQDDWDPEAYRRHSATQFAGPFWKQPSLDRVALCKSLRGGACLYRAENLKGACRDGYPAGGRLIFIGFRCGIV